MSDVSLAGNTTLRGVKALVVGLAREGSAVAQFLAEQGAQVTVTDAQTAPVAAERLAELESVGVTCHLGGHPDFLLEANRVDFLVVSPGVPLTIPFLQKAQALRLPLTTETRLFGQFCPAPVIGISGSSGKTTTTTLTSRMLAASGFKTHVGGNIGRPLISCLGEIEATDRVVMELSSFQLEYFHASLNREARVPASLKPLFEGWSPWLGAILNITPNHLDRHKTMEAYTRAKQALVSFAGPQQTVVLGLDNSVTRQIGQALAGEVRWFSRETEVETGAYLSAGGEITLAEAGRATPVCYAAEVKLRGEHNIANVLAASAIAYAAGATPAEIGRVAVTFTGVAHRLEPVAHKNGVTYINDSIATSPERLMAALNAFTEPIILLAGGKDKALPWSEAAQLILRKTKAAVLFGRDADLIDQAIRQERQPQDTLPVYACSTLADAVAQAKKLAGPGDVVLLSPGCTSYDAYVDFAARGEHFKQLAQ